MDDSFLTANGYHRATYEQMIQPTKASFPAPQTLMPRAAGPRAKLIGKWSTSFVADTRVALLTLGYDGPTQTTTSHQTYWFFDDGTCKMLIAMGGKETTWNGGWDYRDGVLTIRGPGGDGKQHEMDMRVLWYGDTEFELRMADLSKYEQMLRVSNVKSVTCRYEPNGVLHTQMVIASKSNGQVHESATISVQGPQIYERDGDVD